MQQESSQLTQQLNNFINEHRENEQQLRRVCIALEEINNFRTILLIVDELIITVLHRFL